MMGPTSIEIAVENEKSTQIRREEIKANSQNRFGSDS
jgi:hypothetical protein